MYPGQNYNPPVAGIIASWTASRFQYPTLDMLSSMAANQTLPIFMYEFNHVPSWVTDNCLNVTHSTELAFVFGKYGFVICYLGVYGYEKSEKIKKKNTHEIFAK
jgi:carboxylesterase type B